MSEDCHSSEVKLPRPSMREIIDEQVQAIATNRTAANLQRSQDPVHRLNRVGLLLCRATIGPTVPLTLSTRLVTCPDCLRVIDELVDASSL